MYLISLEKSKYNQFKLHLWKEVNVQVYSLISFIRLLHFECQPSIKDSYLDIWSAQRWLYVCLYICIYFVYVKYIVRIN